MFENLVAMVVEKSTAIEKIISSILLDQLGFHQVISANTPEEATRLLKSGAKPDLVISSWDFGGPTTEVFLAELKARREGAPAPFILMTKDASEPFLVRAFKAGVTEYILKPFRPEDFIKTIHKAVKNTDRRKAVRYKIRGAFKIVMKFGKTAAYSGTLMDISTGGAMVKTSQFLQNPVNIFDSTSMTIYAGQRTVELKAELRRMEPDMASLPEKTVIRAAFMFTSVDAANMQKLLDFIESQKPDIPPMVGVE
jgi:two-component system chemotaxis response regulator CheY